MSFDACELKFICRFLWISSDPRLLAFSFDLLPWRFHGYILERKEGFMMLIKWVPQWIIVAHHDAALFLSHCGWNVVKFVFLEMTRTWVFL